MDFFLNHLKEFISLLVPFISWFLSLALKGRAKLIWASPHSFTFLVPEPIKDEGGNIVKSTQMVFTASFKVINVGRETANKIELVFNWKPQFMNLWPVRHYETKTNEQDGRYSVIFDNLSPREEIGLEVLSINNDLPELLVVRSAECQATRVLIRWAELFPQWKNNLILFLLFTGIGGTVYMFFSLMQLVLQ